MVDKRKSSKTKLKNVTPEQAQHVIGKEDFYLFLKIKICSELEQAEALDSSAKEQLAIIRNNTLNQLQLKHKRLAHAYVRRWLAKNEQPVRLPRVMEYDDMVDEAMFGLRIALKRFNPLLGVRISTYTERWMRHTLQEGIAAALGITMSDHRRVNHLKMAFSSLSEELNRLPSEAELMDALKIKRKVYERIQRSQRSALSCQSLDDPLPSDEDATESLGAVYADPNPAVDIDEHLCPNHLRMILQKVMDDAQLNSQEKEVLELHYGLHDGEPKTLQKIGDLLGRTRERVRQIERGALDKLKSEEILTALAPYLN